MIANLYPLSTTHLSSRKSTAHSPRKLLSLSILAIASLNLSFSKPAMATTGCAAPGCLSFPADAGAINVKTYGAMGDGVRDDTASILAAIRAADIKFGAAWWKTRIVYFPPGTYLVSNTLDKTDVDGKYRSGMVLVGASRNDTTIRLKDGAAGYGNASQPKPLIYTSSTLLKGAPDAGGKDYLGKGEGNDAYANYVNNMTIDVGQGNPGAVAIDYLANNAGALRNLSIVASAGSGAIGISMDRKWPGPALVSNVSVKGFDVGISTAHLEYGVTFDKVSLQGARVVSLRNRGNALAISEMSIEGDAPAIQNQDYNGLITAVGLRISGQSQAAVGIENAGSMTLRDVQTAKRAQFFGGYLAAGTRFEGVYKANARLQSATPSWAITPKSAPAVVFDDAPESWANVKSYGAVADGVTDSTNAVLQALRSGAKTVYFPTGNYVVNDTLEVPATVRRIEGMMSTISVKRYNSVPFWMGGGIFKISSNAGPLMMERLTFDMMNAGGKLAIEHVGSGALVLRDVIGAGISLVDRSATGGELFAENICSGSVKIAGAAGAWFRQFNSEGGGTRITNNSSRVWVLGVKTEQNARVVSNGPGGVSEIFGGLVYMVNAPTTPKSPVLFNNGGRLFASYVESAYREPATYDVHLLDQTPGAERSVTRAQLGGRGLGRMVPLLSTPFNR